MSTLSPHGPVIAFDLDSDGHHPSYLQYLAGRWLERKVPVELVVVVAEDFFERHPAVVALASPGVVRFEAVARPEPTIAGRRLPGLLGPFANGAARWRVMASAVRRFQARHCVVMYLDTMLLGPMAVHPRLGCPLSGIYFRPSFHYPHLGKTEETRAEKVRSLRQKLTLRMSLRHPELDTVWSLDPYAVDHIQRLGPTPIAFLADPVDAQRPSSEVIASLRQRYGLNEAGQTLLLFGALTARKGVPQAVEAVRQVHRDVPQHAMTLLVVGRAHGSYDDELRLALARLGEEGVRVIRHDAFVAEHEVQAHFELADIVLAPYQKHVGSSGIAVRAARSGKPVLGSDYGMLGEATRREGLGVAVNSADPGALAAGLKRLLSGEAALSAEGMARYADRNTAERFADQIIATTTGG